MEGPEMSTEDDWHHNVPVGSDRVDVEKVDQKTGWALFTGCEGEDAHFVAFFADRERAERYMAFCHKDSDSDDFMHEGDACVVPALVHGGHLCAANRYNAELGIRAIGLLDELRPDEVEAFLKEAQ
jgi:hypothetical protein